MLFMSVVCTVSFLLCSLYCLFLSGASPLHHPARAWVGASVRAWQSFEGLNVLGFQRRLARTCGLAIRLDIFWFVRTQNGRGKMAAKRQVPMGKKVVNLS